MNNATRRLPQRDCPDCIDLSFEDEKGELHLLFDVCPAHQALGLTETEEERLAREDYERRVDSGDPTQLGYG